MHIWLQLDIQRKLVFMNIDFIKIPVVQRKEQGAGDAKITVSIPKKHIKTWMQNATEAAVSVRMLK